MSRPISLRSPVASPFRADLEVECDVSGGELAAACPTIRRHCALEGDQRYLVRSHLKTALASLLSAMPGLGS